MNKVNFYLIKFCKTKCKAKQKIYSVSPRRLILYIFGCAFFLHILRNEVPLTYLAFHAKCET